MMTKSQAEPNFEPIVGRYLRAQLLGKSHRIYVEEAGQGIPLLCLHTAGADGRQYRSILNDPVITSNFRVIVFDMPRHGKSSPAAGWQEELEYNLTSHDYMEIVLGVSAALGLDRPVVVGCSMGGRIVLHLARAHSDKVRAVVGLQSGPDAKPYYDAQWLHRPDVHGEVAASVVSGLVGPRTTDENRWETLWHYMQGGPGVFKGDLHFYKIEGDIRDKLSEIDPEICPVYLLSGEYDYSCTPEDTKAVAAAIGGRTEAVIMKGMGHFPMSEDPEGFAGYFHPVLNEILAAEESS